MYGTSQKIGVIGGGLMGHGIAFLLADAGHSIGLFEPSADVRSTLAARLRSIVDLLDADPAMLDRIRRMTIWLPPLRRRNLSSKPRREARIEAADFWRA